MLFDTHQIQQALGDYYGKRLQGKEDIGISDVTYIEDGISHYMYSFRLECIEKRTKCSESLILRMGKDKDGLRKEFQVLENLHSTSVPVPRVYSVGEDMLDFGFMIIERVEGENMDKAMDGVIEAEQTELRKQFPRVLGGLHALDWEGEGFDFLDPPEGEYGYMNRWLSMLREWSKGLEVCDLNPILNWLGENKPPSDHYVLLHGDYHPGNVIVWKGEIAAIVDWGGVSIGDAAYDVCWPPLLFRFFDPSGEWSRSLTDSFLENYKKATGKEVRNLDFYQIFKAAFLLIFTSMIKMRGVGELGIKEEAKTLIHPDFDLPRSCAEFIKEKTGVIIQL